MGILMESCSVMRGSKTGFQIKLCERVAPALIDTDGDHVTISTTLVRNLKKSLTSI